MEEFLFLGKGLGEERERKEATGKYPAAKKEAVTSLFRT